MAEMLGLSRGHRRPNGLVGGLVAALRLGFGRLAFSRRDNQLRFEEWPDYLLRDIGLDRSEIHPADPRGSGTDWR